MSEPVAAIVLAAGASTRLGQPKQLLTLPSSEEPLITRAARLSLEAGCSPVIVVLGACEQPCRNALASLPTLRILSNEQWQEGMGATLRTGIEALLEEESREEESREEERARSVLVTVTDQYRLTVDSFATLLAAHHQRPGSSATAAFYHGRPGVPAIFRRKLFTALAALQGDQGARFLLSSLDSSLVKVPLPEAAFDLDTPADMRRLAEEG